MTGRTPAAIEENERLARELIAAHDPSDVDRIIEAAERAVDRLHPSRASEVVAYVVLLASVILTHDSREDRIQTLQGALQLLYDCLQE